MLQQLHTAIWEFPLNFNIQTIDKSTHNMMDAIKNAFLGRSSCGVAGHGQQRSGPCRCITLHMHCAHVRRHAMH